MKEVNNNIFFGENLIVSPKYRLLAHLSLIIAIVFFTFLEMKDIYRADSLWFPVIKTSLICLLVIYLNIYVLAPYFLLKLRWYWVYFIIMLYIAILVYFVEIVLNDAVYLNYSIKIMELYGKIEINPLLQAFMSVLTLLVLMLSSSVVVLFRQWAMHETFVNVLEKNVIQMELEKLKKQINPEFLISTLDKAYTLTLEEKQEETLDLLHNLSSTLRYELYER